MKVCKLFLGVFVFLFAVFALFQGSACATEEVWRINCGADFDYTDPSGAWWMQDEAYGSLFRWGYTSEWTSTSVYSEPIEGTVSDAVYQTNRFGAVAYGVEVPSGTYRVRLMFSEPYFSEPGKRVFDVALEGTTYWQNVDIFAWAGNARHTAMDLVKTITVTDGMLDISFPVAHAETPLLCGIEIVAEDLSDDAFLDFLQKKMFWFYVNECNQATNLVKWGESNWGPGYGVVSSMASNGFALSIYTIGASRGWISEDEAYRRTITMLSSVDALLENKEGMWCHYVDINTGERADGSEISTVDSALFIMGALQAGEYFKETHPDVADMADSLYRRMNWQWFTNVNNGDVWQNQFVNMGWKPENDGYSYLIDGGSKGGFFCTHWWDAYSETVFVDLLAIASPTFPVSVDAWRNMHHPWVYAHGYNYINCPPLFTHQYQSLYYDFRNRTMYGLDFFLNTQKASLANRNTCVEHPELYEEDIWGLTSCGTPDDDYYPYGAEPGGSHDGTIAPTAAITSIMFTERESLRAARKMFFKNKQRIWGLHGFCDSFNFSEGYNFSNWSGNALDNGAMIIAIENYRTGLVTNTFMRNEHAERGLALAGFTSTTDVQTRASSEESDAARAYMAFDDNPSTRWASMQSDAGVWANTPQWFEIDFTQVHSFAGLTIDWESAYAGAYAVQVSDDRMKWLDVFSETAGNGGVDDIRFAPVTGRYFRIYMTQRGTEWGYSIWDVTLDKAAIESPTGVTVANVGNGSSLRLTWDELSCEGFSHYRVYRSTEEGALGTVIVDSLTDTFFDDAGLTEGVSYYYTIRSVNSHGVESSNTDQYAGSPTILAPTVQGTVSVGQVATGEEFTLTIAGESIVGLSEISWVVARTDGGGESIIGTVDGVSRDLSTVQETDVTVGQTQYSATLSISIEDAGSYVITIFARDILYAENGDNHEATDEESLIVASHSGAITGTVTLFDQTNMPCASSFGVDIYLWGRTSEGKRVSTLVVMSDTDGSFSFGTIPAGVYTLLPRMPGYRFAERIAVVKHDGSADATVSFAGTAVGAVQKPEADLPSVYVLRGTVVDAQTGEGLPMVKVSLIGKGRWGYFPWLRQEVMSDNEGKYQFAHVTEGTYRVSPSQYGWQFLSKKRVRVDGGDVDGCDFRAKRRIAWYSALYRYFFG